MKGNEESQIFNRTPAKTWRPWMVFQEDDECHLPVKPTNGANVLLHWCWKRSWWGGNVNNQTKKLHIKWRNLKMFHFQIISHAKVLIKGYTKQSLVRVDLEDCWQKTITQDINLCLPEQNGQHLYSLNDLLSNCAEEGEKICARPWGNFPLDHNWKKEHRGRAGHHMDKTRIYSLIQLIQFISLNLTIIVGMQQTLFMST